MKAPVSWLRDYVPIEMPVADVAERLAVSTCEVNEIARRGVPDVDGNLGRFRVGRVLEAARHPNADKLQLCRVDVGEGEPRSIVCGAWNFGTGATVAVVLPGAVMPGDFTIEERKLRGELSQGMILSERELEIGQDHTGIIVLEDGLEPGTPLVDVLPLVDDVLEIEVTGNRPDLLSMYGLAREIAGLYELELSPPPGVDPPRAGDEPVDVTIDDLAGCPRFVGRLFREVRIAPSPTWLKARLTAAGMRPISNVVDATNYVMLGLGNPLHAYDLAKLGNGARILVRRARPGEQVRTLDGQLRRVDLRDLLITDGDRPVAIAGIMGSEDSEVGDETTDVLLEAANFEPTGIQESSERLGLRTEGSNRWEKGVDPYLAEQAARLATQLIVETAGARWVGHTDAKGELPERPVVRLRPERTSALLGLEVESGEQRGILERLGFDVDDSWTVVVPTWRARDVAREVDLIEEIARFRMDDVPFTLPERQEMFGRLTPLQRLRRRVEDALVGFGFDEVYTPSLVPAERAGLKLPEPLSVEQAGLRTTLHDGLLASARRNAELGNADVELFEIARVYLPSGGQLPDEQLTVAGITERGRARAKGVVEMLLALLGVEAGFEPDDDRPFLPGHGARVPGIGRVGRLHPAQIEGEWGFFELRLGELLARSREVKVFAGLSAFPAVRQDLAFVVDERVPAGDLVAAAREAAGPELRDFEAFDVYRGDQIGAGKKSIAFRAAFQSDERTLSDEDAAEIRARIVQALAERFGAELRA
ncbi:MAG TPA: phenylalanine--tRNA ligase subunit beta [Gaiellaceae bacterium]